MSDTNFITALNSSEQKVLGENTNMDPETAKRIFEVGANLFLLDVPINTEIGVDMNSWHTGPNFKGIKMIPPGVHFIYWSSVSKEGQVAPRSGFFHEFHPKEVMVKRYNPSNESFDDVHDQEEVNRFQINLKNLDTNLGAYPYDSWKKWVSLTNKISTITIERLEPPSGIIQSVTELIPETFKTNRDDMDIDRSSNPESSSQRNVTEDDRENQKLPKMSCQTSSKIRFTTIPAKYPSNSTPAEVTKHSMDSSYQLNKFIEAFHRLYGDAVSNSMTDRNQNDEILGELQFSFICFLVGQNYDAFEQWKQLLKMFCTCDEALATQTHLYMTLISDLHFQIREVPEDFFVDIVSSNNFLVALLTSLFTLIRDNSDVDSKLKTRIEKFKKSLTLKFQWDFSEIDEMEEPDEDKPVIVAL